MIASVGQVLCVQIQMHGMNSIKFKFEYFETTYVIAALTLSQTPT
jgi:hypothetical protein